MSQTGELIGLATELFVIKRMMGAFASKTYIENNSPITNRFK